ncbi:hypothetical protein K439DRAFT_1635982 [Ramaria rubella]|nr:hypothetical protein K439DRAFT_1635982 [Ramaria rubella]
MAAFPRGDEIKKGHICPPSTAAHPEDRWETAFVYSFICKFTKLKQEVDGLEGASDLEEALLFSGPHQILEQILARFILNLRPQTRNTGPEVISGTVATFFAEWMVKGERTNFWDDKQMKNIDPFYGQDPNGFFRFSWDLKLRILRQLVEWQLSYSAEIKGLIDRSWGVVHMKHKKSNVEIAQETQQIPDDDPHSKVNLTMVPLGQDAKKRRYWAVDVSPRLYVSTNPWKVTATFVKISSTKDEYLGVIEDLKNNAPPPAKDGEKRSKTDAAHLALIKILEDRVDDVDSELQRVARARKKFLQKQLAAAQVVEDTIRGPRTRRSTHRPDYVYHNVDDDEEEDEQEFIDDDYQDQDRMDDEADFINDDPLSDEDDEDGGYGRPRRPRRAAALAGTERRRSTRTAVTNANDRRSSHAEWRGERRSSRLGATTEGLLDLPPPAKRSRTSGSATPSLHEELMEIEDKPDPPKPGNLRPNEVALPSVAGKKKSKFWFYAVEPIPGKSLPPTDSPPVAGPSGLNGGGEPMNGSTHATSAPVGSECSTFE